MNQFPEQFDQMLVHTGQHYDEHMSKAFFDDLGIPKPDIDLNVGSGTQAEQTGRIMVEFEKVCIEKQPDLVIVVGDAMIDSLHKHKEKASQLNVMTDLGLEKNGYAVMTLPPPCQRG